MRGSQYVGNQAFDRSSVGLRFFNRQSIDAATADRVVPPESSIVKNNPYAAPDSDDRLPTVQIEPASTTVGDAARKLFIVGILGGAALGTFGYLLLIGLIETLLVPPFKSPPNYGQFGVVVLGVAFYMMSFGMALAAVPYLKWYGYMPIHFIGILFVLGTEREFFGDADWTEAPVAALLFLLALPTVIAICCDLWYRKRIITQMKHDRTNNPMPPSGGSGVS